MRIILLGSRPKNHPFPLVSWLIRLVEWSNISHVGLYFPEYGSVFHAHFTSYEWKRIEDYRCEHNILETCPIDIPDEVGKNVIGYISNLTETTSYKNDDYFKLLFGSLIPLVTRKLTNDKVTLSNLFNKKTNSMVCSVLAMNILDIIGSPYDSGINRRIPMNTRTTTDAVNAYKDALKYC